MEDSFCTQEQEKTMTLNDGIMFAMALGALAGGADCILGNKLGIGEKFEEGFHCLGATALSMVGIICLSPVLASLLQPVIVPLFRLLGADPAMFASILAIDMGGYPLAAALAESPEMGIFSGLIVASMLGVTIVFTIPLGLGMLREADHEYFARGLLVGMIPIPIGSFAGGLMLGIPADKLIRNLLPIVWIALLLMIGLTKAQEKMVRGFIVFGKGIKIVTAAGLSAAAFEYMTGLRLIPGMPPIMEAMETVSGICIVLLGSLPLMTLILKVFQKLFERLGRLLGLDSVSVGGMVFSCVSALPVFQLMGEMSPKGKVMVSAFLLSAISVFSAHLGYTVNTAPEALAAVIGGKLLAAFLAAFLAGIWIDGQGNFRRLRKRKEYEGK